MRSYNKAPAGVHLVVLQLKQATGTGGFGHADIEQAKNKPLPLKNRTASRVHQTSAPFRGMATSPRGAIRASKTPIGLRAVPHDGGRSKRGHTPLTPWRFSYPRLPNCT